MHGEKDTCKQGSQQYLHELSNTVSFILTYVKYRRCNLPCKYPRSMHSLMETGIKQPKALR